MRPGDFSGVVRGLGFIIIPEREKEREGGREREGWQSRCDCGCELCLLRAVTFLFGYNVQAGEDISEVDTGHCARSVRPPLRHQPEAPAPLEGPWTPPRHWDLSPRNGG